MYTEECIQTFWKTGAAFDEPVAETYEEAEEFLEDCMAVVADSIDEVRKYLSGMGADVDGMSKEELEEASEVFCPSRWKISDCGGMTFEAEVCSCRVTDFHIKVMKLAKRQYVRLEFRTVIG